MQYFQRSEEIIISTDEIINAHRLDKVLGKEMSVCRGSDSTGMLFYSAF